MARRSYPRHGIVGVSGPNLNSVRQALHTSGLYPLHKQEGGEVTSLTPEEQIQRQMALMTPEDPEQPTLAELEAAQQVYASYLGDSGYDAEKAEDRKSAKLQALLALAEAGFRFAGETPRVGETGLSTLGRAFGAPLATSMSSIASTFAERDAARRTAQRAEERQIKLQAFQDVTSRKQARFAQQAQARQAAITSLTGNVEVLYNQETFINDTWQPIGNVSREMTGPFKNIPVYKVNGNIIDTPIRNSQTKKNEKDSVTLLEGNARWIADPNDPDGGSWVPNVPVFSVVSFDSEGKTDSISYKFGDGTEARFTSQSYTDPDTGDEVTVPANVKSLADDAGKPTQGRVNFARYLDENGDPTGPIFPTNYVRNPETGEYEIRKLDDNQRIHFTGDFKNAALVKEADTGAGKPTYTEEQDDRAYEGALNAINNLAESSLRPAENTLRYSPTLGGFTLRGVALPKEAQAAAKTYFRNVFDNILATVKTGQMSTGQLNLTQNFVERVVGTPVQHILTADQIAAIGDDDDESGLPRTVPSNITKGRVFNPGSRDKNVALSDYSNLAEDLTTNAYSENPISAAEVLDGGTYSSVAPLPFNPGLSKNPWGRLVLMNDLAPGTWRNPRTVKGSTFENNPPTKEAITNRLLAEQVATDPGIMAAQQDLKTRGTALWAAQQEKKDELKKRIKDNNTGDNTLKDHVNKTVNMLELIDDIEIALLELDPTGFIRGSVSAELAKRGLLDRNIKSYINDFFDGSSSEEKAKETSQLYFKFLAQQNILTQLGGRDILRETGDNRYSDRDMLGIQNVLVKLSETQEMNLATLKELRGYLLGGLNANLTELGAIGLKDSTVIKALQLGASLEGVYPSANGAWSPFVKERYPLTQNPMPGYSEEDHFRWETQGALRGALKDKNYILPKGRGDGAWKNTESIPQQSLFEKHKTGDLKGRYKYSELINNYLAWLK